MTFSQYAGTAIIPTLARIVLGISFLSLGYCRFYDWTEITPAQAQRLNEMGIDVRIESKDDSDDGAVSFRSETALFTLASYRQDEGSTNQPPPDPQDSQEQESGEESGEQDPAQDETPSGDDQDEATTPPADDAQAESETPRPPLDTSDPNSIFKTQRMNLITLAIDARAQGGPLADNAKLIAMGVSVTELVGGGLLLIGLFSRLWAFTLVLATGAGFYFHTMGFLIATGNPFNLAVSENLAQFNYLARHLSFCVLALLVMLAGPGPLSLDRLLFKREPSDPDDIELD